MSGTTKFRRHALTSVLVAASATALAACGSSSSSSNAAATANSGSVAQTAAASPSGPMATAVASISKPVTTWPGPNAPVTPAKGKNIVVVTCSAQGAGCVAAAQGATEAGKALGWNVRTIPGDGTPQTWNAGINTAVAEKADGIILDAVPPALVGDAVAKAQAAKIPVVSIFNPKVGASGGVFSYVTPDHHAQGVGMADWVAADSAGKANVILVEDNEFPELLERVKGFQTELGKCSGCKVVATVQSQIGTMAQKLPGAVTSVVQAHPEANYLVSQYDSNAFFAGEGVRAAGKSASIKVAGYEGDPQAIDAIRKGEQAATVADPTGWMGWQAIDEFARAFAGKPSADVPTQWRLITKTNVPGSGVWTGDLDYQARFRKIWGLG